VSAALCTSRPVYLAIPADVAGAPVPAPAGRLAQARAIPARTSRLAPNRPAPNRTDRPAPTLTEMDPGHADRGGNLTQRRLWTSVQHFLLPGDLVLADQGTASDPLLPEGAELIGPPPFAPIGWAVPAALGVSLAAPDRRVIVVTGGGALQQTAPELDSLLAQGTIPVIIVLNHEGDPIAAPNRHAVALRASSPGELAWALNAASYHAAAGRPVLIEAVLGARQAA
jgi:TPP-dependent 2-oxoacid decarboxylase